MSHVTGRMGYANCLGLAICCYDLNVLYSSNSCVEILTFKVIVLGGGSFGGWSGHQGGAIMHGVSVLRKKTLEGSITFLAWEVTVRGQLSMRK